jgi:hypothetical protein
MNSAKECIKAGWACQSNRIELSFFSAAGMTLPPKPEWIIDPK